MISQQKQEMKVMSVVQSSAQTLFAMFFNHVHAWHHNAHSSIATPRFTLICSDERGIVLPFSNAFIHHSATAEILLTILFSSSERLVQEVSIRQQGCRLPTRVSTIARISCCSSVYYQLQVTLRPQ